jgi:hypothetical protein
VTATSGNGVPAPQIGVGTDTVTWRVLTAAEGAVCKFYISYEKGGVGHGNAAYGPVDFHKGAKNDYVAVIATDQHAETATYSVGCSLNGGAQRFYIAPNPISIE